MNATKIRFEITSDCQCYTCTTCEMGVIGRPDDGRCYECDTELQSDTYCTGACWTDANYTGELALDDWLKSVDEPKHLRIEGRAMGWQRRSGWTDVTATWEKLRDALALDRADWTLRFDVDEQGILTARRYSHDEPTGASFSIYPVKHIPDTMDLDDAINLEIVDEYGCHKGCGEYFYDCKCESEGER